MTVALPDAMPLRRVLADAPQTPLAWQRLGLVIAAGGNVVAALTPLKRATTAGPRLPAPWESLGLAFGALGHWAEAAVAYRSVLSLRPERADIAARLAEALGKAGRPIEAIAALDRAVALSPDDHRLRHDRALLLAMNGDPLAAIGDFRATLAVEPQRAQAHYALSHCAMRLGRIEDAYGALRRTLAIDGAILEAQGNLGTLAHQRHEMAVARRAFRRAIALAPAVAEMHGNLGALEVVLGRVGSAIRRSRRAVHLAPDWIEAHSNLLLALGYVDIASEPYYVEHRRWEARHAASAYRHMQPHRNDPDPDRRLRIGYLSADFFNHALGTNIAGLITHHDRRQVEAICYAEIGRADAMTAHIRELADGFVETQHLDDASLAERLRADGVDILVVLAGHTARNRLIAAARKPAPIMVSYADFSTTGLEVMDYWLTDPVVHPEGAVEERFTERLLRIPMMVLHRPIDVAPDVSPSPATARGHVTFGSFNNPAKIGEDVVALWARLLARVGDARLLLKYRTVYDVPDVRSDLAAAFARFGVDPSRIHFGAGGDLSRAEHLALVGEMDVALDPFPFNGCTTTFEALWMGVPVVTLAGRRFLGRMGASFLIHLGMPELVAGDADSYIDIAAGLAADRARLRSLRETLRPRILASPLCDAPAYARSVEAAFRSVWREWCAGRR